MGRETEKVRTGFYTPLLAAGYLTLLHRLVIFILFCDPVHDAIHAYTHQLVQCRIFVHKNASSFRGWCMLTLNGGKSNYKMERDGKLAKCKIYWSTNLLAGGVYKKAESNNRICKSDKNVLLFLLGTLTIFCC